MSFVTRKTVDDLGRLVIPKSMRDFYSLNNKVDLIPTENGILVTKCSEVGKKYDSEESEKKNKASQF